MEGRFLSSIRFTCAVTKRFVTLAGLSGLTGNSEFSVLLSNSMTYRSDKGSP